MGFSAEEKREAGQIPGLFPNIDDGPLLDRIKYRTDVEKQTLLNILEQNARDINLQVHPVMSQREAGKKIVSLIQSSKLEFTDVKQVIQHDHPMVTGLQLWKKLAGEPVGVHTTYSEDSEVRLKTIESFIGITSPNWIVADSATMVQLTGPGQPRSTSLIPSIHIGVVHIKNILADLSEVYALLRQNEPEDSYVFITGPSKSADIEAQMVLGAHGPKEVHLLVIDEQMPVPDIKGSGLFSA